MFDARRTGNTQSVPRGAVQLARTADRSGDPEVGLRAVVALRALLHELEARHVDAALAAGRSWRWVAEALGVSKQAAHHRHARRRAAENGVERLVVAGEARRSVWLGRREAAVSGYETARPEHLLLGILRRRGPVAELLDSLGVSLERTRLAARRIRPPDGPGDDSLFPDRGAQAEAAGEGDGLVAVSTETREILKQSLREAVRLDSPRLEVEHILLAFLREPSGVSKELLEPLGVGADEVESQLLALLREGTGTPPELASQR
jgi:hypothetical protein